MGHDFSVGFMLEQLIARRKSRLAREVLALYGIDLPAAVQVGERFQLMHRGFGTVIHPETVIGDDVQIYHQVTIGRRDAHVRRDQSPMVRIEIGDRVVIYPGAKILGGPGITRIGNGTIVAANAVVTRSTGENEVWAGVPATLVSRVR